MTEAKLKNGKRVEYVKVGDKHIFVDLVMARWQLLLILFIVVSSILMAVVQLDFMASGFNQILDEIHLLQLEEGVYNETLRIVSSP